MAYGVAYDDIERDLPGTARKTWGSWLFVGSLVLGLVLTLAGYAVVDDGGLGKPYLIALLAAQIAVASFLAWRVRTGQGWLAGGILLAWWIVEALFKILAGQMGFLIIALYLAGMVNLGLGIRACWRLRDRPMTEEEIVATFE